MVPGRSIFLSLSVGVHFLDKLPESVVQNCVLCAMSLQLGLIRFLITYKPVFILYPILQKVKKQG